MCGIAAIFNYRTGLPVDREQMGRMLRHMQRRGPDSEGEWYGLGDSVALGHRRLSIIDLSEAGAQPMRSEDGTTVLTFNGEIYNYEQLRAELEAKGRHFRSHSDTEVLMQLYQAEGEAMLRKLRGMFAFAIWDNARRRLFLARDPFGVKPLYYADDGRTLRVASQVKALLAGGGVDSAPEPAGHVGFFLWGHVPAPHTLYKNIKVLPAGCSLVIDEKGPSAPKPFFSIAETFAAAERATKPPSSPSENGNAISRQLRSALVDTVRHHLIADVPVGVFLSSGLDSTTLTALASESCANLRTVTLGFEEFRGTPNDETTLASEVAAQFGAHHQTIWVSKQDFSNNFERLLGAMDQPSCDGVNSFFISHAAAKAGLKVALSGLGGDELFGSYPSFRQVPALVSCLRPFENLTAFNRGFRLVSAPVLRQFTSPKYAGLLEYGGSYGGAYLLRRGMFMPWELPEILEPELVHEGWETLQTAERLAATTSGLDSPRLRVAALEISWYMRHQLLRDTDWASMNHSLEVRTPFVDSELLKTLAPLLASDNAPTKLDMADTVARKLPDKVLRRPKTGFAIPVRDWLLEQRPELRHQNPSAARGLRSWARLVYGQFAGNALLDSHKIGREVARPHGRSVGPGPVNSHAVCRSDEACPSHAKNFPQRSANGSPSASSTRTIALISDAFGGYGGIAKFNRDLLNAVCSFPNAGRVTALPRVISEPIGSLPARLSYLTAAANSKIAFGLNAIRQALLLPPPELIICGHIHLLPLAFLCRWLASQRHSSGSGCPVLLITHGIEAWQPPRRFLVDRLASQVQFFVAVSQLTKERFCSWSAISHEAGFILPNCVDISRFGPRPKSPELLKRYGLVGKTVLMTLGRLASEERYKGFDEMLELLPALSQEVANLRYLIAGDGPDRARLEAKARALNVQEMVIFAGKIPEQEKADHYRLADAYVMPSHGEGFGIVYLEAMACGIPVVASKVDGSREAVRNGELGELVDPEKPEEIKAAILKALGGSDANAQNHSERRPPAGLDYFSYENLEKRCHAILAHILKRNEIPRQTDTGRVESVK